MPPKLFEPGNQEGRKRGPNKISSKVKEAIVNFLEDNTDKIQESFDELKPIDKLNFMAAILPYAVPKLSSVETETEHTGGITIRFEEPAEYKRVYPSQDQGSVGDLDGDQ